MNPVMLFLLFEIENGSLSSIKFEKVEKVRISFYKVRKKNWTLNFVWRFFLFLLSRHTQTYPDTETYPRHPQRRRKYITLTSKKFEKVEKVRKTLKSSKKMKKFEKVWKNWKSSEKVEKVWSMERSPYESCDVLSTLWNWKWLWFHDFSWLIYMKKLSYIHWKKNKKFFESV